MKAKTNTIKVKVNGKTYTACFWQHGEEKFDQLKRLKMNDAIDDYDSCIPEEAPYWYIVFPHKGKNGCTVEVAFKLDENGKRTAEPYKAYIYDENLHYLYFPNEDGRYQVEIDVEVIN